MTVAAAFGNHSPHWWTPEPWMAWVCETLGTLDPFDPCPKDYKEGDPSGLEIPWGSPCYVNIPGSKKGSTPPWWNKFHAERIHWGGNLDMIWAAFSVEQLRHMRPCPMELPGWLVMPRARIRWTWGGETDPDRGLVHGEVGTSPARWSVFWSTVRPSLSLPEDCVVVPTCYPRISDGRRQKAHDEGPAGSVAGVPTSREHARGRTRELAPIRRRGGGPPARGGSNGVGGSNAQ